MAYRFVPLAGPSARLFVALGDGAFLFAWRMFEISLRVAGGVLDVALLWGVANPIRVYTRSVVRTRLFIYRLWAGSASGAGGAPRATHSPLYETLAPASRPSGLSALARGARRARAGGERCGHVKKGGGTGHADGTRPVSGQSESFIARVSVHGALYYICAYLPCQHLFFNIYVYGIYSL